MVEKDEEGLGNIWNKGVMERKAKEFGTVEFAGVALETLSDELYFAATRFLEKYFSASTGTAHPALEVLNRLSSACKALSVEVSLQFVLECSKKLTPLYGQIQCVYMTCSPRY